MNLPQIDQILTRAIAEMAGHELETINRLEEGDVIRFPGHGIPADELSELEGLLKKKPSAETTQPSKPEKKAPEGPLPRQATSEKPKTVKKAQKPGRLTSLNKGQTVMIHQGGKRKDWYVERTTAGTYVAVGGTKMHRSKTLEGALRWLWEQSQGGMQRQITKVFDLDAIKAGNAPPEEKPMGSLTPKMPEPKPTPTKLGSGEATTILKNTVIGTIGTKAKKMLQNGWMIEVYDAKSPYAKEALGPLPKSEVDALRKKGLMLVTSQSSMTPPEIKLKHIVSDALGRKGRKLLISGWKIAEYTGGKPSNLEMSQVLTNSEMDKILDRGLILVPSTPKTKEQPKVTQPKPAPTKQPQLSPRNRGILNALTKLIHETDTVAQNFRDIAIALEYRGSGDGPEIQKFREDLTQQYGQIHYAKLYGERIRNNAEKIAAEMGKTISPAPKQSIKLKGRTDSDLLMDIQRFATKKRKAILAAKENMESSFKGRMGDQEGKWWSIAFRDVGLEAEDKLADTLKWMASDMRRLKKEIASKKALSEPDIPTEKPAPDAMPAAKDVAKFAAQIQNAFNRLSKTDEYSKGLTRTVRATKRRKFYAIDVDRSGWLLVAPGGDIIGIKAYGVPHYGYQYGNIYDFIKKGGKLARHGFANVVLKPYTSAMAKEYK